MVDSDSVPALVIGYLSVRSRDGRSILQEDDLSDIDSFRGSPEAWLKTEKTIADNGFQEIVRSDFGVAVAGTPDQWKGLLGKDRLGKPEKLVTYEELVVGPTGQQRSSTHVGLNGVNGHVGARIPDDPDLEHIDGLIFERPRAAQAEPSATPPKVDRFHLNVPDDVATVLGADQAHLAGHRGNGVLVAMVDTGFYPHPFYAANDYKIDEHPLTVVPDTEALEDPYGHGTGEAANLFAVAPGATLLPIRASDKEGKLVGTLAGFMLAKTRDPWIITNSWSGDYRYPNQPLLPLPVDRMLELEIRDAIARDIVVVFAAGNGTFAMEAQIPGVISAGGVYADPTLQLSATPYTSAFVSPWYKVDGKPVKVPTVCGLVGMPPRASYLMLPVPPESTIDKQRAIAARVDPPDGTAPDDGWALFSGTSAAAPQVAGAAAVLREMDPTASVQKITQRLCETATDVRDGRGHARFGNETARGLDLATGHGLINVAEAVADWGPRRVSAKAPPAFITALWEATKFDEFLDLICISDGFRERFEDKPAETLLKEFDLTVVIQPPVRLVPKVECRRIRALLQDQPFDVVDPSGHITLMLH